MKLAYGIFYTKNIEAITQFYREILGLEFAFGNERFVAFKIGDALLGIKIQEHEREVPGCQTIIVQVSDAQLECEKLKAKSANFYKELSDEAWGKNFAVLDLDGNKIEFVQNKQN